MSRTNDSRGKLVPLDPNSAAGKAKVQEAETLKERVSRQVAVMEGRMADIDPWLRQSGISPDAFISSFRLAMARDPKIANCTPMSLLLACMDCARVGLPPDGKKAALVPFKNRENGGALEATLIVMYQGHLDVIYRTGLIASANCGVIYEDEDGPQHLTYSLGTDAFVDHHPPINRDDSKPIIAAWATAVAKDGVGKWAEVMGQRELARVAATNKVENGPGKQWPSEMARKAPLRRMVKFLPKHPTLDALAAIEARAYKGLSEDYGRPKPKLSNADLLGDGTPEAPEQQQIENNSTVPMEEITIDDMNLAGAVLRFSAMMEQADEPEILQGRAQMILADPAYDALDSAEKALVDMALRENRERLGVDPDAPVLDS